MTIQQPRDAPPASHPAQGMLVAGVGNDTRADDGVGPHVVALLAGRVPGHVRLATLPADPLALMDAWEGASRVVVVDAMHSGAAPGTVERLDLSAPHPSPAILAGSSASSHGFGLAETLALARALDRLPPQLVVFGIEAASFAFGAPLSHAVAAAAIAVADRIAAELRNA